MENAIANSKTTFVIGGDYRPLRAWDDAGYRELLTPAASRHDASTRQIALAWILAVSSVTVPIPGDRNTHAPRRQPGSRRTPPRPGRDTGDHCGSWPTVDPTVSVRRPPWPARTPERPRRRRRPRLAHGWASRARTSWPILAATIALTAPMAAAGSHGAGLCRAKRRAAGCPQAPVGRQSPLARACWGVVGSLSTTSSPAAAATKKSPGPRAAGIPGAGKVSERATTVATPSWLRAPDAAPRSTLPTSASRQVGLALRLVKMAGFPITRIMVGCRRGPRGSTRRLSCTKSAPALFKHLIE